MKIRLLLCIATHYRGNCNGSRAYWLMLLCRAILVGAAAVDICMFRVGGEIGFWLEETRQVHDEPMFYYGF